LSAAPVDPPTGAQAGAPSTSLSAGRVGRAHGLDGSFYVTRPRPRLLDEGTTLAVAALRTRIVRRAGADARPIVRVEGVDSREAAERLRGQELIVDGVDLPALDEGEYWAHELEGCAVYAAGRKVGVVARMLELPSCEALEVVRVEEEDRHGRVGRSAEPLLVPMVKEAVLRVAPGERRIEIDLEFLDLGGEHRAGRETGVELEGPTGGEHRAGRETGVEPEGSAGGEHRAGRETGGEPEGSAGGEREEAP
jgi:16S rRNA processing protein RimM